MMEAIAQRVIELTQRPEIEAIGLHGSHARQLADGLSDIDICVFVQDEMPSAVVRKRAYANLGFTDFIYFDVDFEQSRGDGINIDGVRCDFVWMSIPLVQSFLNRLEHDFDGDEWLAGGLSTVKALHDPRGAIAGLQSEIPSYSEARARHRVRQSIGQAHYSLYGLGWLKKAAVRRDYFSFLKNEHDLLEKFFYALFALNHTWFSDEKRLASRIQQFEYVPEQADRRVQSIIMRQDGNEQLAVCLANIKQLFRDTVACAHRRYPDLDLPVEWT